MILWHLALVVVIGCAGAPRARHGDEVTPAEEDRDDAPPQAQSRGPPTPAPRRQTTRLARERGHLSHPPTIPRSDYDRS